LPGINVTRVAAPSTAVLPGENATDTFRRFQQEKQNGTQSRHVATTSTRAVSEQPIDSVPTEAVSNENRDTTGWWMLWLALIITGACWVFGSGCNCDFIFNFISHGMPQDNQKGLAVVSEADTFEYPCKDINYAGVQCPRDACLHYSNATYMKKLIIWYEKTDEENDMQNEEAFTKAQKAQCWVAITNLTAQNLSVCNANHKTAKHTLEHLWKTTETYLQKCVLCFLFFLGIEHCFYMLSLYCAPSASGSAMAISELLNVDGARNAYRTIEAHRGNFGDVEKLARSITWFRRILILVFIGIVVNHYREKNTLESAMQSAEDCQNNVGKKFTYLTRGRVTFNEWNTDRYKSKMKTKLILAARVPTVNEERNRLIYGTGSYDPELKSRTLDIMQLREATLAYFWMLEQQTSNWDPKFDLDFELNSDPTFNSDVELEKSDPHMTFVRYLENIGMVRNLAFIQDSMYEIDLIIHLFQLFVDSRDSSADRRLMVAQFHTARKQLCVQQADQARKKLTSLERSAQLSNGDDNNKDSAKWVQKVVQCCTKQAQTFAHLEKTEQIKSLKNWQQVCTPTKAQYSLREFIQKLRQCGRVKCAAFFTEALKLVIFND